MRHYLDNAFINLKTVVFSKKLIMKNSKSIFIGLGANLPSKVYGEPIKTLEASLRALKTSGIKIVGQSRWYSSLAFPDPHQPKYLNGVVSVRTDLTPKKLLNLLNKIEDQFGRVRTFRNAPRVIDLDLLAFGDTIRTDEPPLLPHPRLAERSFVLKPLSDIEPTWVHPLLGLSTNELIETLPESNDITLYN